MYIYFLPFILIQEIIIIFKLNKYKININININYYGQKNIKFYKFQIVNEYNE